MTTFLPVSEYCEIASRSWNIRLILHGFSLGWLLSSVGIPGICIDHWYETIVSIVDENSETTYILVVQLHTGINYLVHSQAFIGERFNSLRLVLHLNDIKLTISDRIYAVWSPYEIVTELVTWWTIPRAGMPGAAYTEINFMGLKSSSSCNSSESTELMRVLAGNSALTRAPRELMRFVEIGTHRRPAARQLCRIDQPSNEFPEIVLQTFPCCGIPT